MEEKSLEVSTFFMHVQVCVLRSRIGCLASAELGIRLSTFCSEGGTWFLLGLLLLIGLISQGFNSVSDVWLSVWY